MAGRAVALGPGEKARLVLVPVLPSIKALFEGRGGRVGVKSSTGERLDAFSDLDTNANGVLDEGDANVSVDAGDTIIDLGGQTDGESEGTLKLVGLTGLEVDDMSFS